MVKKLKNKFILISVLSFFIVTVILISSINAINLYNVNSKADMLLQLISQNNGYMPEIDKGGKPPINFDSHTGFGKFELTPETRFETRYFWVQTDLQNNITRIDTSHIAAVCSADAADFANKVLTGGNATGYENSYKFLTQTNDLGTLIIFLDCHTQLQTALSFFLISCAIALVCTILVAVLVSIFSGKAVAPVAESLQKQKQFITDASHEIKTPLAIISADIDVMKLNTPESEWLISMQNQVTRLDKLVKSLVTLAKMDESDKLVNTDSCELTNIIKAVVSEFDALACAQNKKFDLQLLPSAVINGNKDSLYQLVQILVDNAVKYSIANTVISIWLFKNGNRIVLQVANKSDSLNCDDCEKLFDRFYRTDASRTRKTGGFGLGLSIAKSIINQHNGKITAKFKNNEIIFTVTF